jgi:hypothetical protein
MNPNNWKRGTPDGARRRRGLRRLYISGNTRIKRRGRRGKGQGDPVRQASRSPRRSMSASRLEEVRRSKVETTRRTSRQQREGLERQELIPLSPHVLEQTNAVLLRVDTAGSVRHTPVHPSV